MCRSRLLFLLLLALLGGGLTVLAQEEAPPKALLVDYPLKIYLDGSGPLDLVYVAPEAQTINVYVTNLDNDPAVDTMLEIFGPEGDSLAFNDDLVSDNVDPGIENLALPAAGTYRVNLNTFTAGERGGVEIQVEVVHGRVRNLGDLMNNDGGESTTALDVTDSLDGRTPASYSFEGTAGQVVTIKAQALDPAAPDLDLMLTLYGPDGTVVEGATDDDTGVTIDLGETDPAILDLELPETGTYRVEVTSWFGVEGQFRLIVEAE